MVGVAQWQSTRMWPERLGVRISSLTPMSIEFIGFTLDVIGKVMVAYAAIKVHHRFWQEHKVDEFVFKAMKREQIIGIIGIILIIAGFLLQIPYKL